ncbi:MAG: hypothetical protein M3494_09720 [Actinomycetota bacterium]|nr:hypothetical protein [Actinomycetota bacterium]
MSADTRMFGERLDSAPTLPLLHPREYLTERLAAPSLRGDISPESLLDDLGLTPPLLGGDLPHRFEEFPIHFGFGAL